MASLLDDIKARLDKIGNPTQVSAPQQQAVQNLMTTKATGKATPQQQAPAASNLQEQAGIQATQDGLAQVGQQAAVAAEQISNTQQGLATQQQKLDSERRQATAALNTNAKINADRRAAQTQVFNDKLSSAENMKNAQMASAFQQNLEKLATQRGIATDDLFENYRQGTEDLSQREDAAELSQLAFQMEMSNREFIDTIQQIGKYNRLDNEVEFKTEAAITSMGESMSELMKELDFTQDFNEDVRIWNQKMSRIDFSAAMDVAAIEAQAANTSAMIRGASGAAAEGVNYYAKSTPSTSTSTGGNTGTQTTIQYDNNNSTTSDFSTLA